MGVFLKCILDCLTPCLSPFMACRCLSHLKTRFKRFSGSSEVPKDCLTGLQALHPLLIPSNVVMFYTLLVNVLYIKVLHRIYFEEGSCYPSKKILRKPMVLMDMWRRASLLANSTQSSPSHLEQAGRTYDFQLKSMWLCSWKHHFFTPARR